MIAVGYCKDCGTDSIKDILCKIDTKLSVLAQNMYQNMIYGLKKPEQKDIFHALERIKSILQKKLYSSCYTEFSTDTIISKAKQYLYA